MALPAYIDETSGEITDGEAWVGLATNAVTGTSTAIVAFESTDDGQVGDFSMYMDLFIVGYASAIYAANTTVYLRYNLNDDGTGANYYTQEFVGDGSSVSSSQWGGVTASYMPTNQGTAADVFGVYTTQFFDINSGKYKASMWTTAIDGNQSYHRAAMFASTWKGQAPITKIELYEANGFSFVAGSKFSLFGILPRMVA